MALGGAVAAAVPAQGSGRRISFDVQRDGTTIGRHEVALRRNGDYLEVDVSIDLAVHLAFIPVFSYRHRNHEVWKDGRLVSLDSETNDDGERFSVTARSQPDGLHVVGSGGAFRVPATIVPTSYWNPLTIDQSRLLDSQHGRILSVRSDLVSDGERIDGVPARRYRVTGDLDLDLWYSEKGEWLKIAFEARGAEVVYARRDGSFPGGASG
mgnify:CR=1 FL=1